MLRRGGRRGVPLPAALALAAVLAATAGCGGLSQTRLLGSGTGGALTTIGFGVQDDVAQSRVDVYRKSHPDVDLQVNEGAFDAQQFLSAVASGRPPDLVYFEREQIGSYAHRGALQPLTRCLQRSGVQMNTFRDSAVQQVTVDGAVYAMPEFTILQALFVNDKAAADAGVAPADIDTADWDGLVALGQKMNRKDGGKLSRLGFYPKVSEYFPLWAHAAGADLLSADGTKADLDSDPAVQTLTRARAAYAADGGFPVVKAFSDSWDIFGEKNQYATDQVGMEIGESWYLNTLASNSADVPVSVLPIKDRDGKTTAWAGGNAWAIPAGARHYDEACDFIATMTAADTWVAAAKVRAAARAKDKLPFTGLYTANKVADARVFSEVYKPSGVKWIDAAVKTILAAQDAAFASPPSPAGAEVKAEWQAALGRSLLDDADPAKTLRAAQRQAQAAIDSTNATR